MKRDLGYELKKMDLAVTCLQALADAGDPLAIHTLDRLAPLFREVKRLYPKCPKAWEDVPQLAQIEHILRENSTAIAMKMLLDSGGGNGTVLH